MEGKQCEELSRTMRRRLSWGSKAGLGRKLLPEQGRARPKGSKGSLHKHGDDKRPGKFEAKKEEESDGGEQKAGGRPLARSGLASGTFLTARPVGVFPACSLSHTQYFYGLHRCILSQ